MFFFQRIDPLLIRSNGTRTAHAWVLVLDARAATQPILLLHDTRR